MLSFFLLIIKSWRRTIFDFSQLGEEKIIDNIIFRLSKNKKFQKRYIDIGCFDPIKFSNTFKLYQKGWSGIVIEPNKTKTRNWKKIRPRDTIINSALVPENFESDEIEIYKDGDSDPSETTALNAKNSKKQTYRSKVIKLREIDGICKKVSIKPFLINIDIENKEDEILKDFKLLDTKIPIICVELLLNKNEESIFDYQNHNSINELKKLGYILVSVCGVSLIFCHKDFWIPFYR
tara:strand:- start:50 stop:754 length:705 start_codon:yes stop_codon:yes gene_type:complete